MSDIQRTFSALKIEIFIGQTLFFLLFLIQNIHCGYTLEPPRRGGSNEYPQCMFWIKAVLTCTHNVCFGSKIKKVGNTTANPIFSI